MHRRARHDGPGGGPGIFGYAGGVDLRREAPQRRVDAPRKRPVDRSHLHLVSPQDEPRPTIGDDALEGWSIWMRAQSNSPRTIQDRSNLLRRFAAQTGVRPEVAEREDVLTFLAQPLAAGTRQTYFSSLRAFYSYLRDSGQRADDPTTGMRRPRCPRRHPRPVTTDHLERLLATRMHRRTRTMILLAAYQGLRVHEIAKVRGEDVDAVSMRLRVVGKGGVDVDLPLHPVIAAEADRYPARGWWFPSHVGNCDRRAGGPILARSVSTIVSDAMGRACVPGTAHSLRHWYGTELLRAGANARVTQELLRHASLATTALYTAVASSETASALAQLPLVGLPQ